MIHWELAVKMYITMGDMIRNLIIIFVYLLLTKGNEM